MPEEFAKKEVSTTELAAVLGLTVQRINQLKKDGVIISPSRNTFILADSIQAYVKFIRERDKEAFQGKQQARDKYEVERARKLKIENDTKARELMTRDDTFSALDFVVGAVKLDLAAIPARVTSDPGLQRQISDAVDDALEALSGRFDKACGDLEAGRDPLAAVDPLQDG